MAESQSPENLGANPTPEIEIGGGDPLRITAFEEIVTTSQTGNAEIKKLPDQALKEATEQLKGLPFAVGNKNFIGTEGMRNKHDVVVRIGSRAVAYNAPQDEQGKHTMYFRFGETAGLHGLHLSTHKDLTVLQDRDQQNGQIRNIVSFSPDKPLNVAGKEVREVALVMPTELPKPKA